MCQQCAETIQNMDTKVLDTLSAFEAERAEFLKFGLSLVQKLEPHIFPVIEGMSKLPEEDTAYHIMRILGQYFCSNRDVSGSEDAYIKSTNSFYESLGYMMHHQYDGVSKN